ncbi:MAG: hypothetical protein JWO05_2105 [Gemmatimonadetes bacterium]|nr:hypothetical protein [Gemmatimonadota bacterium]
MLRRTLLLLTLLAPSLPAQLLTPSRLAQNADSAGVALDIVVPPIPTLEHSRLPYVFVGVLATGLVVNRLAHVDADGGGYSDGWNTRARFSDKFVHALSGFALTSVGIDMRLAPWSSALLTCGAGAGFEFTQGYVSVRDIAADCAGAAAGAAWRKWRAHR